MKTKQTEHDNNYFVLIYQGATVNYDKKKIIIIIIIKNLWILDYFIFRHQF